MRNTSYNTEVVTDTEGHMTGPVCRDFGFDPLGLGEVPENLERFKESELIHARWAMLAVVSAIFPGFGCSSFNQSLLLCFFCSVPPLNNCDVDSCSPEC